jgi:phosphatidylserine decarboxylase
MPSYLIPAVILTLVLTGVLAWKWHLGVVRVGIAVLVISAVWGPLIIVLDRRIELTPAAGVALTSFILTLSAAVGLLYCFYRDPDRTTPPGAGTIVSPADGEVVYVHRVHGGEVPVASKAGRTHPLHELTKTTLADDEAYVIGISMNFLDVHVNRAPIAGTIAMSRHFPGGFGSLRKPDMVFENERATTVIEGEGLQVAVVQIASRLVRRIVSFVGPGDDVERGQRVGAIRFGSQVDLVLPASSTLRIEVQAGDRVSAGTTVVATGPGPQIDTLPGRVDGRREATR